MRGILAALLAFAPLTLRAADPVEFTISGYTFRRPDGWGWVVPTSPMRKAQLSVPARDDSQAAEVTFFHFGPGQGGSVDANVQRWVSQFEGGAANAMKREETLGSVTVTFVRAEGTFQSGMPGGPATPMAGFALRGAILSGDDGDVFVKMTGPKSVVEGAGSAFEKMIREACETK